MAVTSWALRHQNVRSSRFRPSKRNKDEDILASCLKQEPYECFQGLLGKICEQDVQEGVLLNYLNTFVKILLHYEGKLHAVGYSTEDILCFLRLPLMHESTMIRAAGLRCIRYVVKNEDHVIRLNELLIYFLITRSLDMVSKNDVERIEAMKLMRKILILSPSHFNISMARSLVSLANEGTEGKDRMLRICLATLSEIGVLNSKLFIISGGVTAITRNLIECQTPKIAESLCGVLLLLLDKPSTRHHAAIDLHSVAAPFCDFHYKHCWKDKNRRDERELRLNCSRLALLTILRSWPGILHFCSPKDKGGFKAIVDVLYLNQLEVRKAVLDLLYELLGLPQPEWTDEVSVALSAVDPCEPQASWRLKEGFVVAEGRCVLPHMAKTTPSLTDMHLALLLFCFLENGLLGALTEVITTSDTFISVRATILLGELLRLIQILLPPNCCNLSPSLPALLEYATQSKPQAMGAVTALQQLHKLMKKRPASYSLHLDYILRNSYNKRMEHKQEKITRHKSQSSLRSKLYHVKSVLKDGEDIVKETGVLSSNDAYTWNWNLIKILLRGERNFKIDLTDSSHKTFIKKLVDFFMPSQNKYSHMDLGTSPSVNLDHTTSGIELINFLVELKEPEYNAMVLELFKDILSNIIAITTSRSVHDCLFSPQHMVSTQCQSYFLFIGQFARNANGSKMLNAIEMFTILKELATTTNHDCYVKLIISSLEYIFPGPCRDLLEAVLTCNIESSRLYATQFLLVLLRAGNPNFADWAIKLLVRQLQDKSRSVYLSALSTLQEACEVPECLEALIESNPDFDSLGEKGMLLSIRFLSTERGFKKLGTDNVLEQIKKWDEYFLFRYVKLAEGDISDALTLHQRNEDGKYDKRVSTARTANRKDVFLPPHLYGQLNQHVEGFQLLMKNGSIYSMVETIKKLTCETDEDIVKLKASVWVMGHLSTSNRGFNYLSSYGVVDSIIGLAKNCEVYSIRATAFYALGLIATTKLGADELSRWGWLTTRHHRHDSWPVIKEEVQDRIYMNHYNMSISDEATSVDIPFTVDFDNIDDEDEDEKLDLCSSPIYSPDIRKVKQSTLPANRTPPEVVHQRSLSESKTFDTSNGYEDDIRNVKFAAFTIGRQRNSSMTESTTSGVSSCDSLQNRPTTNVNHYLMTLSPIPSSSSLSTLRLPPDFKRNSYRVSSNSATGSDVSSSSLTGSVSNELSFQNLLGYNAIRFIRRPGSVAYQKEEDYLFKPPPQTSNSQPILIEDLGILDPTTSSLFSGRKFQIVTSNVNEDQIYMGICLPKVLTDIFPNEEEILKAPLVYPEELSEKVEIDGGDEASSASKNSQYSQHHKEVCFCCSKLKEDEKCRRDFLNDVATIEVLRNVERLSNPVMSKQVKSHLFHFKQREPQVFTDLCIYSEACKMLSQNSYRLSTRRMLHELFMDIVYDELFEWPRKILTNDVKKMEIARRNQARRSIAGITDILSPTAESFKTLDSLKLICNENKFPIKNVRKNTN